MGGVTFFKCRTAHATANSALAALSILKIETEAHTSGLTDRMTAFIKEEMAKSKRA